MGASSVEFRDALGEELALRGQLGEGAGLSEMREGFGGPAKLGRKGAANGVIQMIGTKAAAIRDGVQGEQALRRTMNAGHRHGAIHGHDG